MPSAQLAWIYLLIAGLFEVAWAIGLKYTDGFSRLWPSLGTVTAIAITPCSPTAIPGFVQVTVLPELLHENCADVTPVTVTWPGTTSLTDTFVAGSGPLLVTSSSHVKPPPAPTCGTLAVLTIAMSVETCCGLAHADVAGG